MNELRVNDLFDLEPMDTTLRSLLRPWRMDLLERAPQIKIDLSETDDHYAVKAEIPGVKKEDIDIRIEGNRVTISAELKKDSEEKEGTRTLRSERQYGYSSRSFMLASEVDESKSDAKYRDGVLQLMLPKKAATTQRKLVVA
ncbi:MAG: Hsp20/alpha crystallin family protein [Burkholderiales bacterium]|nr:Hsp20/alpha crystallin family protein [Burkholderiales bacterium]